jgi:hypothetical protein
LKEFLLVNSFPKTPRTPSLVEFVGVIEKLNSQFFYFDNNNVNPTTYKIF